MTTWTLETIFNWSQLVFSGYLRIEIADIHCPADLVDFGRVHVAHDGELRRGGAQRGVEPKVQGGSGCRRQTQLLSYANMLIITSESNV